MLDLIYKLTYENDTEQRHSTAATSNVPPIEAALSHTDASIIIFDANNSISYASPHAPVHPKPDGSQQLDLMFDSGDITFEYWLKDCQVNKMNSEKLWTRIHTNPDSADEPRIFDIAASYSRDSETQIVMVLQDRTSQYEPDEKILILSRSLPMSCVALSLLFVAT